MPTLIEVSEIRHLVNFALNVAEIVLLVWIGVLLIRLRRLLAGTQQEQRRAIHALGEKLKSRDEQRAA